MKFIKNSSILLLSFLLIILPTLLLSEIWVLNQNFILKKKIRSYKHLKVLANELQNRLNQYEFYTSIVGKPLPFKMLNEFQSKSNDHIKQMPISSQYVLLFFFSLQDCSPCLEYQIETWNGFHESYPKHLLKVIGIVDTTNSGNLKYLKKELHLNFPLFHINDLKDNLQRLGVKSTPAVFFGSSKSKKVIFAFLPNSFEKSDAKFIKKLELLLQSAID